MTDIVREFLLETHENLGQLDLDLVILEREPGERETLARVFRTLHTIKGTAGFLGLGKLQAVAHAGENLLGRIRAGEIAFDPEIATALLAAVDAIRKVLAAVEATEQEGDGDYSAIIKTLDRLTRSGGAGRRSGLAAAPAAAATVVAAPAAAPESAAVVLGPTRVRVPEPPPPPTRPAPVPAEAPEPAEARTPAVADTSIRVDVGLLDKLMNLVGELVLARNQIIQFGNSQEDRGFVGTLQRLSLLTTELQAGVMKTRMQPVGTVWAKFPRLVRDLAAACGKQVRIDLDGQETELDRTIIEAVRDPLTHMVRNAVDHGIEPPAERAAHGKPAEGRLLLHAFHEGGKVVIEITDDGCGIDPSRVRDKAVRTGLVPAEQAARMSDHDLVNLVFLPGFSTADRVTQFSGRGVGMDVVRTNIEKIGGTVDIDSRPRRGTTVRMKIPLTLAIIPALTVTAGGDRYAIPQVSLLELVRLEGEQVRKGVEQVHGAPVYRLRGNLLPLVYLDRELGVESGRRTGHDELNIVVLQADDRQFGLVVGDIHDTEEIVVKPLQKQVKGIAAFSAATIMGDGQVALILDVLGLAQRAGVVSGARDRALDEKPAVATGPAGDRQAVLLCTGPDGGRIAIPLTQVARLEEFPRSAVERVGGRYVVQYRGEILPLVHISRALGRTGRGTRGTSRRRRRVGRGRASGRVNDSIQVVVHARPDRQVGLVVARILDIAEETIAARSRASRPGVLFTAVIQDRVTEVLDVEQLVGPATAAAAGG
ncbi:MAG TPA: chemotaxis protein CheA [Gemmataceae bacterium]|nr:chemotaxis protein CheA [Gemmataceae bacterium]